MSLLMKHRARTENGGSEVAATAVSSQDGMF